MKKALLFWSATALLLLILGAQLLSPVRDASEMENRMLEKPPALTWDGIVSGDFMETAEKFAADQLPLRDGFVAVYALTRTAMGQRASENVIRSGDWLFDGARDWNAEYVTLNARALHFLAEKTGKRVCLLAVPSSACVYFEKLPAYAPAADEEALLDGIAEETELLPLLRALISAKGETPLYYRTDHHWTAAGAQIGYETACAALGLTPLSSGEVSAYPGFYGSYYARDPLPFLTPDTLTVAFPDDVTLTINGEEKAALADEAALAKRDKYAALLYGNQYPVIELTCDSAPEGELLVIRDSYANALLPALCRHYRRIVAVDPRYYREDITALADQVKGDTVLCVYGLRTLAEGAYIYQLEGL